MSEIIRIRDELDKAAALVITARRLLAGGATIELSALEGRVRAACDAAGRLPRDEAGSLVVPMEELMRALDGLEGELTARHLARAGTPPAAF